MRGFLVMIGFLAGYGLQTLRGGPQVPLPESSTCLPAPADPIHAQYMPTLRDAIGMMADYEIKHVDIPRQIDWYGWTDGDIRTSWQYAAADLTQRRKIALHELIHVTLRMRGDPSFGDEELVKIIAQASYGKLFGGSQ